MAKRERENKLDIENTHQRKRHKSVQSIENISLLAQNSATRRQERIEKRKRKMGTVYEHSHKKICLLDSSNNTDYLNSECGMVNFSPEYIQYLKESYPERSYVGKPEYRCKHCDAIFWFNERNKTATDRENGEVVYSNCCKNGKIKIPKFRDPPTYLKNLLDPKGDKNFKHFLQKIRQYNSMFAFTSMGGNIDQKVNQGNGPYISSQWPNPSSHWVIVTFTRNIP